VGRARFPGLGLGALWASPFKEWVGAWRFSAIYMILNIFYNEAVNVKTPEASTMAIIDTLDDWRSTVKTRFSLCRDEAELFSCFQYNILECQNLFLDVRNNKNGVWRRIEVIHEEFDTAFFSSY
jgi:hypothetical protein